MAISIRDKIDPKQYRKVAESVIEEWKARKDRRKDLVRIWDEIDRQLRMQPETSHKQLSNGQVDPSKNWMPETELPLQAQTLEMLTADIRRLKFPPNRDWFQVRAALTEDYIERWQGAPTVIPGEKGENMTNLAQDDADQLVRAALSHCHGAYDFRGHWDMIDAQAITYGFGPARLRRVEMRILSHDARQFPNVKIPVLVPRKARCTYLDDSSHAVMHEGVVVGPNIIQDREMKLSDLKAAAAEMPDDYIVKEVNRIKSNSKDNVTLLELEGDLVLSESASTTVFRNVIVTVAIGTGEQKDNYGVIKLEEGEEFSTYVIQKYHVETPSSYGTSPLIKGYPIAKAAAQAMNRLIESGQLKITPPLGYPRDSASMAATGGPVIFPGAQWEGLDELKLYSEVGGEPEQMWNVFAGLIQLYTDVTGVTPSRLGAQTKSHTTAFAKDVELNQGAARTVDYVRSSLEGPMTRFLELEYRMLKQNFGSKKTIFIRDWNEFATITKDHLPDIVHFSAIGAGAPAEEQARVQNKITSAQTALQIDTLAMQMGREPTIDPRKLIEEILTEGGWTDISALTQVAEQSAQGIDTSAQLGILTAQQEGL